jgi:hypothetical protein
VFKDRITLLTYDVLVRLCLLQFIDLLKKQIDTNAPLSYLEEDTHTHTHTDTHTHTHTHIHKYTDYKDGIDRVFPRATPADTYTAVGMSLASS